MIRVLVVRHSDAGERSEWRGDDRVRPLTDAGRDQAERLAQSLDGQPLSQVLTSGYARCVQTVAPLATRRGLEVEVAPWLEEGADPVATLQTLMARGDALACTHGDVVSGILFELADRGVSIGTSPRMQKGSTWVLDVENGAVAAARYLPPPA
ncbi:MAG: phosphoglycerate mutase family protein [Candidatus Dormiibacterota bacterium]